ncbi:MAG: hypothetical protein ABI866_10775 [Dokdonella sp.]
MKIIASIASALAISIAHASDCQLVPIVVSPASPEPAESFVGQAGFIELQFQNDISVVAPDAFPESPLVVKNHQSNTTCSIEGGIWVRHFVFASGDSRILATKEYSGSNESLFFYDTKTCKRVGEIDLSEYDVKISESGTVEVASKAVDSRGHRLTGYQLDAACTPRKTSNYP